MEKTTDKNDLVPQDKSKDNDEEYENVPEEPNNEDDNDDNEDDNEDDDDDDLSSFDSLQGNSEEEIDPYDESALPEFACRYCGIYDPACVVKCVETKKYFCNAVSSGAGNAGGSSHIVYHLVRSRSNQVQLHPESPLGDTVLECYHCGGKNIFVLGFVPASGSSVVVLLCRVCVETVPALKDMDWELSQWHPLIQDRKFLPWLVKVPSDKQVLHCARDVSQTQINKLEEMWKNDDPDARFADLDRPDAPGAEEETLSETLLQYEDGYHYQNILAPLVKLEADYDKQMKESLSEESISVRWEKSLMGKNVAVFHFGRTDVAAESRIMVGDELRLKLGETARFLHNNRQWEGVGYVKNIVDGELELELRQTAAGVPEHITDDFIVEYIWKSTSFDRMQNALKTFAIDDTSVTGYIYHMLLGHAVEEQSIAAKLPPSYEVEGLPSLNESQEAAVAAVLQRPMSLIQVSNNLKLTSCRLRLT